MHRRDIAGPHPGRRQPPDGAFPDQPFRNDPGIAAGRWSETAPQGQRTAVPQADESGARRPPFDRRGEAERAQLHASGTQAALPSSPVIVWKIKNAMPKTASIRYRCLLPLQGLRALGWDSLVLVRGEEVSDWSKVAALVNVKSFEADDVALAEKAAAAGVPILIDLCDNIFADVVDSEMGDRWCANFHAIAARSRAVTVTSPAMRELIGPHLGDPGMLRVIPDQVEAEEQSIAALDVRSWRRDPRRLRRSTLGWKWKRLRRNVKLRLRDGGRKHQDPGPTPPKRPSRYRVIWFGTHGRFGRSGLSALAEICPALVRVNKRLPLELLVVSNNEQKFDELIASFPFPAIYRSWHPTRIFDDIRSAEVFVMPNSGDAFSLPKSAGRAVLALSLGVPVAATMTPSLEPLSAALFTGDWEGTVSAALSDPVLCAGRLAAGRAIIESQYSGPAIAARWDSVLREAIDAAA